MTWVKLLAQGAKAALMDDEIRGKLIEFGKTGLTRVKSTLNRDDKLNVDNISIDKTDNKIIDKTGPKHLEEYLAAHISVWAQAAQADGVLADEEEDVAFNIFLSIAFEGTEPLYSPKLINELGLKKKDITSIFETYFSNPMSVNKIVVYASQHDLEENFYQQACLIVNADNKITPEEKEFLEMLGTALGLSKYDRKRIHKDILSDVS